MQTTKKSLIPEKDADFRSTGFWDGFFEARGDQAFEWYGDWKQLRPLITQSCKDTDTILVPGCGNSELSAKMYDAGFQQITNLDFSKPLIISMMKKHVRERPAMKWLVGDMTNMKFPDRSFSKVLDKGGLDALLGEDASEGVEAAESFLQEVERVLTASGVYVCISLLQAHVLRLLLARFGTTEWDFSIDRVPPSTDMARNELQPMFISAKRRSATDASGPVSLSCNIATDAKAPNAEQLKEMHQVLEDFRNKASESNQNGHLSTKNFDSLFPGRIVELKHIPEEGLIAKTGKGRGADTMFNRAEKDGTARTAQKSSKKSGKKGKPKHSTSSPRSPGEDSREVEGTAESLAETSLETGAERKESRYRLCVVDVEEDQQRLANTECCVFLIPQGRDAEWMFASEEGRRLVASRCSCKRMILVALGRGHSFGTSQEVQDEVSGFIKALTPANVRRLSKAVPILTCQDGVGNRRHVDSATSSLSGKIVVEDVELREGDDSVYIRRLVFASNRNLIQSEARLREKPSSSSSMPASPTKESSKASVVSQIDWGVLCMDYHIQVLAALISGRCIGGSRFKNDGSSRGLLIGLGGGVLAEILRQIFKVSIQAVELDPVVVDLAKKHFQLQERTHLKVTVGDGLEVVKQAAEVAKESAHAKLNFLIVDAGSNDGSLAMTCPPPPFLEAEFLHNAKALLSESGLLVMNCVTRSEETFKQAIHKIQAVFGDGVQYSKAEHDVNRVVVASKQNTFLRDRLCDIEDYTRILKASTSNIMTKTQISSLASDLADVELMKLTPS